MSDFSKYDKKYLKYKYKYINQKQNNVDNIQLLRGGGGWDDKLHEYLSPLLSTLIYPIILDLIKKYNEYSNNIDKKSNASDTQKSKDINELLNLIFNYDKNEPNKVNKQNLQNILSLYNVSDAAALCEKLKRINCLYLGIFKSCSQETTLDRIKEKIPNFNNLNIVNIINLDKLKAIYENLETNDAIEQIKASNNIHEITNPIFYIPILSLNIIFIKLILLKSTSISKLENPKQQGGVLDLIAAGGIIGGVISKFFTIIAGLASGYKFYLIKILTSWLVKYYTMIIGSYMVILNTLFFTTNTYNDRLALGGIILCGPLLLVLFFFLGPILYGVDKIYECIQNNSLMDIILPENPSLLLKAYKDQMIKEEKGKKDEQRAYNVLYNAITKLYYRGVGFSNCNLDNLDNYKDHFKKYEITWNLDPTSELLLTYKISNTDETEKTKQIYDYNIESSSSLVRFTFDNMYNVICFTLKAQVNDVSINDASVNDVSINNALVNDVSINNASVKGASIKSTPVNNNVYLIYMCNSTLLFEIIDCEYSTFIKGLQGECVINSVGLLINSLGLLINNSNRKKEV